MTTIRPADLSDLEFLIRIDLEMDGYTVIDQPAMSEQELAEHRAKIRSFLTTPERGALILEEASSGRPVGEIMYAIANRNITYPWKTVFHELDPGLFQADGRLLEIYSLWIHPDYRRAGHASRLKLQLEDIALAHGVDLIYTHTEEANPHVVELNEKLGYTRVRRGPIWDEVVRISLVKKLK